MRIVFVLLFFLVVSGARASVSFGCSSNDNKLGIGLSLFDDGDGLWTLFGDFKVSYEGKQIDLGPVFWFKFSRDKLDFTNYSITGRRIKIFANKVDRFFFLKIDSGFIEVDKKTIDLKEVLLECSAG
ncbi:MAG: hypothetical protein JNL11_16995 [Bdellovibrionaceae bacterium]|nr:hypothetical protein [Pseudobdellovibrionaceae bacterium]